MRWIVDAMNVIGSRPDGWWKDRRGAMDRLVDALERWAVDEGQHVTVVFERPMSPPIRSSTIEIAHAPRAGANAADDEIVRLVRADGRPDQITVVTSDGALVDRVLELGATTRAAAGFRRHIEASGARHRARAAVAGTGILVAAIRAAETARDDALFRDPFADRLAGEAGRRMLAAAVAATGEQSMAQIVVRTRFWDEALLRAQTRQVVILAAGMDARAYRLPWPSDTTVYEVDQPAVMTAKAALLADDSPRCRRVPIGIDLVDDWPGAIASAGLDPTVPTAWLIEGLLQYLEEGAVATLFDRVDALSAPGSVLLYDVVGKTLLESPALAPLLRSMADQGSPWLFGSDVPATLVEHLGWTAVVTDVAEPGRRWNRWSTPVAPKDAPGAPRGYFVEAHR